MKKLFRFGLLLAAFLTLSLTSCNNNNNPEEEEFPGKWTSAVEYYNSFGSFVTRTGSEFNYRLENPQEGWHKTVAEGQFGWSWYDATKETIFTGFKATASASEGDSGCGFIFNWSKKVNPDEETNYLYSYYSLIISGNSILVSQCIDGVKSAITDEWETCSSLLPEPGQNTITVYTDDDGSIIIDINGEVAKTIRNPQLKKGSVGIIICCGNEDQVANKTITTNFKFLKFQH